MIFSDYLLTNPNIFIILAGRKNFRYLGRMDFSPSGQAEACPPIVPLILVNAILCVPEPQPVRKLVVRTSDTADGEAYCPPLADFQIPESPN